MVKKMLWIRELSCGHERPTSIEFMMKQYSKPIVGQNCHCRECIQDFEIIGVRDAEVGEGEQ